MKPNNTGLASNLDNFENNETETSFNFVHHAFSTAGHAASGAVDGQSSVLAVSVPAPKPATIVGGTTPQQAFKSFYTAADLPTDTLYKNEWHLLNTGQSGGKAGVVAQIANHAILHASDFVLV